ncbi:unnamed protein product [Camellia sinensis]
MSKSGYCSKLWGDVLNIGHSNPLLLNLLMEITNIVVGNGIRIQFWDDHWVGNLCVENEFPRLYSLSTEKEVSLSLMMERKGSSTSWIFNFRRPLFAWEADDLATLNNLLNQAVAGLSNRDDCLRWLASSSGQFRVSSLYNLSMYSGSFEFEVTKLLWNNVSPPKAQFLGWLLGLEGEIKNLWFPSKTRSDWSKCKCHICVLQK